MPSDSSEVAPWCGRGLVLTDLSADRMRTGISTTQQASRLRQRTADVIRCQSRSQGHDVEAVPKVWALTVRQIFQKTRA